MCMFHLELASSRCDGWRARCGAPVDWSAWSDSFFDVFFTESSLSVDFTEGCLWILSSPSRKPSYSGAVFTEVPRGGAANAPGPGSYHSAHETSVYIPFNLCRPHPRFM